jgi:HD-GYP domain-containing protein (c-di-GMP phosphodiesterase class II)
MEQFYIPAKQSNLRFYQAVPLYFQDKNKRFVLYKPAGNRLDKTRIEHGIIPGGLFLKKSDELKSIREIQNAYHHQLKDNLKSESHTKAKNTLTKIVKEIFSRPISGSLEGLSVTVNILVGQCNKEPNLARYLLVLPHNKYDLFLHSVNVMLFAVDFCFRGHFSIAETKILGLSALLHDVGKTKINPDILKAPNRLNDDEFKKYQTHTTIGYRLIKNCKFPNPDVSNTALQHHERIDGGGYPNQLTRITKTAQITGLIDCYESLTKVDRPYRGIFDPLKTLSILKDEVETGKFDRKIFEKFVYTLT